MRNILHYRCTAHMWTSKRETCMTFSSGQWDVRFVCSLLATAHCTWSPWRMRIFYKNNVGAIWTTRRVDQQISSRISALGPAIVRMCVIAHVLAYSGLAKRKSEQAPRSVAIEHDCEQQQRCRSEQGAHDVSQGKALHRSSHSFTSQLLSAAALRSRLEEAVTTNYGFWEN